MFFDTVLNGFIITICLDVILTLVAIPSLNYLNYGVFWYWVRSKPKKQNKWPNCGCNYTYDIGYGFYECFECLNTWKNNPKI